jgi:hypothetical protein
MSTEIDDIRKAYKVYITCLGQECIRKPDQRSKTFRNAEAFLLMVRNKYGTANPNEIENLLK